MTLVNPVANNHFTVFLFDAAPPDASPGGPLAAGAGLAAGAVSGSFSEVSGLDAGVETEEYREGGANAGPHLFHKWGTYAKLVLKRGTTLDPALWDWHYQVLRGNTDVLRKNGLITLTDRGLAVIAAWYLERGLPERLQGPTLSGTGSEIAIETLEIAHEGLTRVDPATLPGLGAQLAGLGL